MVQLAKSDLPPEVLERMRKRHKEISERRKESFRKSIEYWKMKREEKR